MVLAVAIGWSLQRFAGIEQALLPAILIGMVLALFVPPRGACALERGAGRTHDGSR